MPRMALTAPLPDPDILTEVLRLSDAVDAIRVHQPYPLTVDLSTYWPPPETAEEFRLREYLAGLSDDHQSQIHALYWIGRSRLSRASQYEQLYHHALTTDLGERGAGYLSEKDPFGDCLRRGLEKLGLRVGPSQTHTVQMATFPSIPEVGTPMKNIAAGWAE